MIDAHPRRGLLWMWLVWLGLFYGAWMLLMLDPGYAADAWEHRPIALTMLFGSYVAGSTPMGGNPWLSPFSFWLTDSQPHSVASIVTVAGVGIDMLIYASLVLAFRVDPKVAIPTSVLAMAFNSVLGLAVQQGTTGIEAGVWGNWLAAAPVVVLGALLGLVGMAGACVAVLLWVYALDRLQAWGETRAAA